MNSPEDFIHFSNCEAFWESLYVSYCILDICQKQIWAAKLQVRSAQKSWLVKNSLS